MCTAWNRRWPMSWQEIPERFMEVFNGFHGKIVEPTDSKTANRLER
jgi:hypothetical protein